MVVLLTAALISAHALPGLADPAEDVLAGVTAGGAVLWEPDSDTVLVDREARAGRPMASTTKVMTVLLALEAGAADDDVVVSPEAAEIGRVPGGATLGLSEGRMVPMRSLLAGLVLRSGNDAAVAVADHLAGGEDAFVAAMNERAAELGLEATTFLNSSGLIDDPAHEASPLDLARLASAAMAHEDFARWAGAAEATIDGLGTIVNRNELLGDYRGATGVKTGFTSLAGLCLIASATRGDRTLYAVVLDSEESFADAAALLDHGFDDYRPVDPPTEVAYAWADAEVTVRADRPAVPPVLADSDVVERLTLVPAQERPLPEGAVLGESVLLVDGTEVDRSPLLAGAGVPARPRLDADAEAGAALHEGLRGLLRIRPLDYDA